MLLYPEKTLCTYVDRPYVIWEPTYFNLQAEFWAQPNRNILSGWTRCQDPTIIHICNKIYAVLSTRKMSPDPFLNSVADHFYDFENDVDGYQQPFTYYYLDFVQI